MRRHRTPELMDDPSLDAAEHRAALRALERSNRLLRVDSRLWRAIRGALDKNAHVSVLELGAGSAGFLRWALRSSRAPASTIPPPRCIALDVSHRALADARDTAILPVVGDARAIPLGDGAVDVVTCSLLLHHFDPPDVVRLLRESARVARVGIVMGDLTRSRPALAGTWIFTRLFSRSHVFHIDAALSVRAAFTPRELRAIAHDAGLTGARVTRHFPFRMLLTWNRTESG